MNGIRSSCRSLSNPWPERFLSKSKSLAVGRFRRYKHRSTSVYPQLYRQVSGVSRLQVSQSSLRDIQAVVKALSRSASSMSCQKIDGAAIASRIKERLHARIQEAEKSNPHYKPSLKIVQVGDRPDSTKYVRMKLKAADEANISCERIQLPSSVTESEVLRQIHKLNEDHSVHAILVQLPLPEHISEHAVTSAVSETKDVDGFRTSNTGEIAKRGGKPLFVPCTPKGIMALLAESGVELRGQHAVVLGRSDIVGGPVSYLLKNADATVTICHSLTQDLPSIIKLADVLVVAIGKPRYVQGTWLKKGAVVIDVGTNYIPDSSKKSGYAVVGDVDYESAIQAASMLTPVPGGVGPMTVAMLLQNVVEAATAEFDRQKVQHQVRSSP